MVGMIAGAERLEDSRSTVFCVYAFIILRNGIHVKQIFHTLSSRCSPLSLLITKMAGSPLSETRIWNPAAVR